MIKYITNIRYWSLVSLCLWLVSTGLWAQGSPTDFALTRGQFWIQTAENGWPNNSGLIGHWMIYPGYFQGGKNYVATGVDHIVWKFVYDGNLQSLGSHVNSFGGYDVIQASTVTKNYNFTMGINIPEEMGEAILRTYFESQTAKLIFKLKMMVWGIPKYDDFIITRYTIINDDVLPVYNFHYMDHMGLIPSDRGGHRDDTEYIWDEKRHIFIFYDDTRIPHDSGVPVSYSIPPGDVTGDVGDPGNINAEGSIDFQLYSPQALAYGFVEATPQEHSKIDYVIGVANANEPIGEDPWDRHREIGWGAPQLLQPNADNPTEPMETMFEWTQTKANWRELHNDPNDRDGSLYERTPQVVSAVGPYTIEPGDSIVLYRIHCGGDMDRNVSMRGGLEATKKLDMNYVSPEEGAENEHASIKELRKNWDAALYLIENNLTPDAVPPPTCGLPPRLGFDEHELNVETALEAPEGSEAGVDITWDAVPDDYVDPITGIADHVGYKIYQSDVGIEGPWILMADLQKDGLEIVGGKITYTIPVEAGVPYRYAVTSYDSEGLESAKTAYTYYSHVAKRGAVNDLDKVVIVPNPFKQKSGYLDPSEDKLLSFYNIPGKCTIRIYNLAGDLINTLEHDDGLGEQAWGSSIENDYMLTQYFANVMPGIYIYHIESHVSGHEGETAIGKFVIIK